MIVLFLIFLAAIIAVLRKMIVLWIYIRNYDIKYIFPLQYLYVLIHKKDALK